MFRFTPIIFVIVLHGAFCLTVVSCCGREPRNNSQSGQVTRKDKAIYTNIQPFSTEISPDEKNASLFYVTSGNSYGMTIFFRDGVMVSRVFSVMRNGVGVILEDEGLKGQFKQVIEKDAAKGIKGEANKGGSQ